MHKSNMGLFKVQQPMRNNRNNSVVLKAFKYSVEVAERSPSLKVLVLVLRGEVACWFAANGRAAGAVVLTLALLVNALVL